LVLFVFLSSVSVITAEAPVNLRCSMLYETCDSCIRNGCSWCADGYCAANGTDLCEPSLLTTKCGHRAERSGGSCDTTFACANCAVQAGCTVCVDIATLLFKCVSGSCGKSAGTDPYAPVLFPSEASSFIPQSCPVVLFPGASAPIFNLEITLPIVDTEQQYYQDLQNYVAQVISEYLKSTVTVNSIIILSITFRNGTVLHFAGRQSTADQLVTVQFTFADTPSFTAQQLGSTLVAAATAAPLPSFPGVSAPPPPMPVLAPGSPQLEVAPLQPSIGSGTPFVQNGGSDDISLSGGALAGIIVGCVIGAVLIGGIVAYFVLVRSRGSGSTAFRGPTAAYRP